MERQRPLLVPGSELVLPCFGSNTDTNTNSDTNTKTEASTKQAQFMFKTKTPQRALYINHAHISIVIYCKLLQRLGIGKATQYPMILQPRVEQTLFKGTNHTQSGIDSNTASMY